MAADKLEAGAALRDVLRDMKAISLADAEEAIAAYDAAPKHDCDSDGTSAAERCCSNVKARLNAELNEERASRLREYESWRDTCVEVTKERDTLRAGYNRLMTELTLFMDTPDGSYIRDLKAECTRLRAEVERLRRALDAVCRDLGSDTRRSRWASLALTVARAALKVEG